MVESSLDTAHSILYVHPESPLNRTDFEQLAEKVDPFIESTGGLHGLIIEAPKFPGWENFGGMVAHVRFVRDHHRRVRRIAVVTDSAMGNVAEHLAAHFVSAQIRHFAAGELDAAKQWIMAGH